MGNSNWSDERFIANRKYKALCMIMTPNGIVKEGTVLTAEEWKDVLVFGIGHDFDGMFELINEPKELPKLFKKTTTGAIQEWTVSVDIIDGVPTIINNYGQVDGKIQESKEQVLSGKNTGRANATTALEQAEAQAKSRWEKQLKKGYVQNIEDAQAGKTDDVIEGGIFPILAHKFWEQGHKIKFPALAQPKLDGHRCTSQNINGEITLWSRTRKPIKSCPHIIKAIAENCLLQRLDGELYNHEYKENFEDLTSLITPDEPQEGHENIQYHVYDTPIPNMTNFERNKVLQTSKSLFEGTPIHIVETRVVNSQEELMQAYEDFMEMGYEGAIVRNMDGMYVNKRSYDLQKVKVFDDDEFRIVDIKVGTKGTMAGKAVFICERTREDQQLPAGVTFDCKLKGKLDDLKLYADDKSKVIGKIVTVQYQGYTRKNKKPRFPVALRFRVEL
jgi:DNA ligase 1